MPPPYILPTNNQTFYSFNASCFYNTLKYRKYMDTILKVELGSNLYIRVSCFYKAFFKDIEGLKTTAIAVFIKFQNNNNPFYSKKFGWHNWPQNIEKKCLIIICRVD